MFHDKQHNASQLPTCAPEYSYSCAVIIGERCSVPHLEYTLESIQLRIKIERRGRGFIFTRGLYQGKTCLREKTVIKFDFCFILLIFTVRFIRQSISPQIIQGVMQIEYRVFFVLCPDQKIHFIFKIRVGNFYFQKFSVDLKF